MAVAVEVRWAGEGDDEHRRSAALSIVDTLLAPPPGPYGRRRTASRVSEGAIAWEAPVTFAARPGTGGRQPRLPKGFETEATRDLLAELGDPHTDAYKGTQLHVWRVGDGTGGILAARLSSEDLQHGETAMGQVHVLREMAERLALPVGFIIVALKTSGALPYEERLDFAFIASQIQAGTVPYVAFRQTDRIARHTLPAEHFYHHLEEHGIDLYLSQLGRRVDWRADRLYLLTSGMFSENERAQLKDRTHGALQRRYLETGRGWPAAIRFGFRRGRDGFPEVDPEQWYFVERLHFDYATLFDGRGSVRRLAEHLANLGCRLSPEGVRKMLRDRIYVDGEYSVNHEGRVVSARPIPLPNPIPREVFERNQRLLDSCHGRNSITPFGSFLLNYVPLLHARCIDQTVSTGDRPRLSGRAWSNRRKKAVPTYIHTPRSPASCRGYSLPARELEHAVIRHLRALAQSPELQLEWTRAGRPARLVRGELTREQRDNVLRRMANLRRQRERIMRTWLDESGAGQRPDTDYLQETLRAIDADIDRYRRQLDLSDALARQRRTTDAADPAPPSDDLTARLLEVLTLDPPEDPDHRQRRVAVAKAVLSAVIVHDTDDGVALELHGPLVPPDAPLVPLVPAESARHVLGCAPEPSTKATLGGQSGGDDLVPAWRSPRLETGILAGRFAHWDDCVAALRYAHEVSEPGRLFGADNRYVAAVSTHPELPGRQFIIQECRRRGTSATQLGREVLGEEGLRMDRFRELTRDDLVTCVAWALEEGFNAGPGWTRRWEDFARPRPFLRSLDATRKWAKRHGMTMSQLFEVARAELEK